MTMRTISDKEKKELTFKLDALKKKHPRRYGKLDFNLNDMGTGIMLGVRVKGHGFNNVTMFMSYEAMWCLLNYLYFPIEEELKKIKAIYG